MANLGGAWTPYGTLKQRPKERNCSVYVDLISTKANRALVSADDRDPGRESRL